MATLSISLRSPLQVTCGFFRTGLLHVEVELAALRTLVAKGKFNLAVNFYSGENHSLGGRIEVGSI